MDDAATDDRHEASLVELGAAVRELNSALADTTIESGQARDVAARVREITRLIDGPPRDAAMQSRFDDLTHGVRFFSPVSGPGNAAAPPLTYDWSGDDIVARFTLGARFGGPPGYIHGGVIALVFDEVLAHPAIRARRWGMTAFLNVNYRRASPLNTPLVCRSRITSVDGRKTFVTGELVQESEPDAILASGDALFVIPRADTAAHYFDESVTSFRPSGTPR